MKLEFEIKEIGLSDVDYGDVLVMSDGSKYLITSDTDGSDYRAVNLETFRTTDYQCAVEDLIDYEFAGTVERVIKSDNLVLGVR